MNLVEPAQTRGLACRPPAGSVRSREHKKPRVIWRLKSSDTSASRGRRVQTRQRHSCHSLNEPPRPPQPTPGTTRLDRPQTHTAFQQKTQKTVCRFHLLQQPRTWRVTQLCLTVSALQRLEYGPNMAPSRSQVFLV